MHISYAWTETWDGSFPHLSSSHFNNLYFIIAPSIPANEQYWEIKQNKNTQIVEERGEKKNPVRTSIGANVLSITIKLSRRN